LIVAPDNEIPVGFVVVSVPPHTVAVLLATVNPVGSVSLNATPVRAIVLDDGFVIVNVSEVVAFNAIAVGLNALAIDGGPPTVRFAGLLALPVPPSTDDTAPVVFVYAPAVAPVTVTLNWQWPLAATVAPAKEIPVGAVVVSVPPHTVAVLLATVKPVGSVSVNATPFSTVAAFPFVMVNCSDVVVFNGIEVGLNTLAIVGGCATVRFAVAVLPVPALADVTDPVVFVYWPAVAPVTVTLNWQEPPAATVAPNSEIPVGAVVVRVPPHTVAELLATVKPVGSVSVNATPLSAVAAFPFVMVNVSELVVFNGICVGVKAFEMLGGESTVRFAVAVFPVPPLVDDTAPVVLVN
jgi:sorbitol-specific phosphotransferase system component IIC